MLGSLASWPATRRWPLGAASLTSPGGRLAPRAWPQPRSGRRAGAASSRCSADNRERASPECSTARTRLQQFTVGAVQTVHLAEEEARRTQLHAWGPEHILLGLIGQNSGTAARALRALGVTLDATRAEVDRLVGAGPGCLGEEVFEVPPTPLASRVLAAAAEEARQLGDKCIGTEHLLLALLRGRGLACRVLQALGTPPHTAHLQLMWAQGRLGTTWLMHVVEEREAAARAASKAAHVLQEQEQPQKPQSWWHRLRLLSGSRGEASRNHPLGAMGESGLRVFALAEEEARRLGSNYVDLEHILLGLVWDASLSRGTSAAAGAFWTAGITLHEARDWVDEAIGGGNCILFRGPTGVSTNHSDGQRWQDGAQLSSAACRVSQLAQQEAWFYGQTHAGSAHVLLGLLRLLESRHGGEAARRLRGVLELRVHPRAIHILRAEVLRAQGEPESSC